MDVSYHMKEKDYRGPYTNSYEAKLAACADTLAAAIHRAHSLAEKLGEKKKRETGADDLKAEAIETFKTKLIDSTLGQLTDATVKANGKTGRNHIQDLNREAAETYLRSFLFDQEDFSEKSMRSLFRQLARSVIKSQTPWTAKTLITHYKDITQSSEQPTEKDKAFALIFRNAEKVSAAMYIAQDSRVAQALYRKDQGQPEHTAAQDHQAPAPHRERKLHQVVTYNKKDLAVFTILRAAHVLGDAMEKSGTSPADAFYHAYRMTAQGQGILNEQDGGLFELCIKAADTPNHNHTRAVLAKTQDKLDLFTREYLYSKREQLATALLNFRDDCERHVKFQDFSPSDEARKLFDFDLKDIAGHPTRFKPNGATSTITRTVRDTLALQGGDGEIPPAPPSVNLRP